MSDVSIPPTFSGDYLSSASLTQSTLIDFGEFSVIQGPDDYVQVGMADQIVFLANLFFVVKPSLRVYAMDSDDLVSISQVIGCPIMRINQGYSTPLLAFGGWAKDKWLRFTFRHNPHSLLDYGWISEATEENPLTPEWESFILSHGQEISHA